MKYVQVTLKIPGGDREALAFQARAQQLGAYDINTRLMGTAVGRTMTGYQSNSSNPMPVLESAKSRAESVFRKSVSDLSATGRVIGTLKLKAEV